MIELEHKFITKFLSMLQDQCISITDLRTQTKKCLENLEKTEKYVFVNNKPKAVIVDIKSFEILKTKLEQMYQLTEMNENEISPKLRAKIEATKKLNSSELINI